MTNNDLLSEFLEDDEFRLEFLQGVYVEKFLGLVEQEMLKQNVTRTELAKRMGCSSANITRIFREDSNLTSKKMVQIADALNLDFIPAFKGRQQAHKTPSAFVAVTGLGRVPEMQAWSAAKPLDPQNDNDFLSAA